MAYQVIARKWRPQRFNDMVGQEHIARTLKNSIRSSRVAHAYLFVGPRGIGKTTSARIFAKALNCKHPEDGEPCCKCSSCTAIANESSVDVIEIDAATHTQVDKARDICEEALHMPIASRYKVFIIDEVHMLSKQAWNALLKTIEEPPPHAKFIFATTEVNKVLPTVISRCQRFDLRRIPSHLIAERLVKIAQAEGVKISPQAIEVIARAADGGMRDGQSLLDQLISFFATDGGGTEISEEQAISLFGLTASSEMLSLVRSILTDDKPSLVTAISSFAGQGKNLEVLFDEILSWLRGVMLAKVLDAPESCIEDGHERVELYKTLAEGVSLDSIQRLLEQLSASGYMLRDAINKQVFLETLLLKAMRIAHAVQIDDLIARLNQLRKDGGLAALDLAPPHQAPEPQKKNERLTPPPAPVPIPQTKPVQPEPASQPAPLQTPRQERPQRPQAPSLETRISAPELWHKLVDDIAHNIKNPVVAGLMSEGRPESLKDSVLTVCYDDEYEKAHCAAVEKDIQLLTKRLQSISGDRSASLRILRKRGLASPIDESADTPSKDEMMKEVKENAFVQSALDIFEGRVVDVHG